MSTSSGEITCLLERLKTGDRAAEVELISRVYRELRRLAAYYLRQEKHAFTLQPTALVHEAYLKLTALHDVDWQSRSHFFAVAATVMRNFLIDHARARMAHKRGNGIEQIDVHTLELAAPLRPPQILALDEALTKLSEIDPRQAKIVELRYFGGLTEEEVADVLRVSARTVKRDWRIARAWLYSQLK